MRSSSGQPGSMTGSEPTAMMALLKVSWLTSSLPSILSVWSSAKVPVPLTTLTLRLEAMDFRPPVSWSMTDCL